MTTREQTEILFKEYLDKHWTQDAAIVALVFKALSHAALDLNRINRIGAALADVETCDLSYALAWLVRRKVLRAYTKKGVRLYEVNY